MPPALLEHPIFFKLFDIVVPVLYPALYRHEVDTTSITQDGGHPVKLLQAVQKLEVLSRPADLRQHLRPFLLGWVAFAWYPLDGVQGPDRQYRIQMIQVPHSIQMINGPVQRTTHLFHFRKHKAGLII